MISDGRNTIQPFPVVLTISSDARLVDELGTCPVGRVDDNIWCKAANQLLRVICIGNVQLGECA